MSASLIRTRYAAVAVKVETTSGVDAIAGSPAAGDWLGGECEVSWDQQTVPDPTMTGSLDSLPDIVGTLRPNFRIRVPLRGSGAAGTAPEWGKLLRACSYAETVTAAVVGAPTAATAGTTTGATAATPFVATADAYRGMPLALTGNITDTVSIIGYTAGRVATFAEQLGTSVSTATLLQIPVNVRYAPTSDEALHVTLTVYVYRDGLRWRFTGVAGTFSLELNTGSIGFLSFDMRGRMSAIPDAVALPTGWNQIARQTPPRWVAGRCQFNRTLAQLRSFIFNANVGTTTPDNPESVDGYDPAIPISRASGGTMDPLMNVSTYAGLFSNFQTGIGAPFSAIIGGTAGNRFLASAPLLRSTSLGAADREGLTANQIGFRAEGPDSGFFLTAY